MLTDRSVLFFFSSRRRHTRWTGDWSSDVCSSDLIGDRKPYNVALIVLDRDAVAALGDGAVTAEVERAVDRANAQLSRPEQIKRLHVLDMDWAPGGDELTPTLKLKRRPIESKYAAEIEALYAKPRI